MTHLKMFLLQAVGKYLLAEMGGDSLCGEQFLLCRPLSSGRDYVVLTQRQVIGVSWPGLRFFPAVAWTVQSTNMLCVRRLGLAYGITIKTILLSKASTLYKYTLDRVA